jgi:hypothetical protein
MSQKQKQQQQTKTTRIQNSETRTRFDRCWYQLRTTATSMAVLEGLNHGGLAFVVFAAISAMVPAQVEYVHVYSAL